MGAMTKAKPRKRAAPAEPIATPELLDRKRFFALVEDSILVALPGSVPVLLLIDLPAMRALPTAACADELAGDIAQRISAALGNDAILSSQCTGRFAALIASDGPMSAAAAPAALLAALVDSPASTGATFAAEAGVGVAIWGEDGLSAEQLFVAADQSLHVLRSAASPDHAPVAVAA